MILLVQSGIKCIKNNLEILSGTDLTLEFSPENFSQPEPDYAIEVCNAVLHEWDFATQNKVILNLSPVYSISLLI